MEELRSNGVDIYKFPTDDETVAEVNGKMNVSMEGGGSCKAMGGVCLYITSWQK